MSVIIPDLFLRKPRGSDRVIRNSNQHIIASKCKYTFNSRYMVEYLLKNVVSLFMCKVNNTQNMTEKIAKKVSNFQKDVLSFEPSKRRFVYYLYTRIDVKRI